MRNKTNPFPSCTRNPNNLYRDTLHLMRWVITSYSLSVGCPKWYFPRVQYRKREEKENFAVEKPEKHYLKPGSRATMISHTDSMYPCYDVMRMHFNSVVFCPVQS